MDTFWSETFPGPDADSWSRGWSVAGNHDAHTATVVAGRGRLTAGPSTGSVSVKVRLERMRAQADTETVFTFIPPEGAWFLTVGARTLDNGSIFDNYDYSSPGMYARLENFFGSHASFVRQDADSFYVTVAATSTGLPAYVAGTAYKLRYRLRGKQLSLRVWAASAAEPAVWNLTVTDQAAYIQPGKATLASSSGFNGEPISVDIDDVTVLGLDPVLPTGSGASSPPHEWTMWSRAANYSPDRVLPIASAKVARRHMGINAAVVETEYTPERWVSLQPSRGLVLYRDGRQEFTGLVVSREQTWDADSGRLRIRIEAASDEQHLADRLVFPDPLRAADDQTVNDYWTFTGVASAAMLRLISDQAGPTCRVDRRVPGLALGADPGVGVSRKWTGLFNSAGDDGVLDQLAAISIASGQDLGLRFTSSLGALTADIVQPRDLTGDVRFSADLRNLVGYSYKEQAPTATHGLAAGQGDLHLRLRKQVTTLSTLALAWGRQIWKYVDRRDTADVAELSKAAADAVTGGDAKVALAVTLTDSQAARYGIDWDLGDRITIYVAPPGQGASVAVADVVREIVLEVNDQGAERITPAVGTHEASALPSSPTQQQLSNVGSALAGLIAWK